MFALGHVIFQRKLHRCLPHLLPVDDEVSCSLSRARIYCSSMVTTRMILRASSFWGSEGREKREKREVCSSDAPFIREELLLENGASSSTALSSEACAYKVILTLGPVSDFRELPRIGLGLR